MLKDYEGFIKRVNQLGFMSLSLIDPGFPSLTSETSEEMWHSDNEETDPWKWKDKAASLKDLAFGSILGGNKGFISPEYYPLFYNASHPKESINERWMNGEIDKTVWDIMKLFEEKTMLNTSDIRRELSVSLKKGASKVDRALIELQNTFYISIAGNRQRTDKLGKPFGWPAIVYDLTINWAPKEWIYEIDKKEAREKIIERALSSSTGIDIYKIEKILKI